MTVFLSSFLQPLFFTLNIFFPLFIIFLFLALWKGAPFVPASRKNVETMVQLTGVAKGDKTVDLGSGDGRVVIAMAKQGVIAHGYEINPFLVLWSRLMILKNGLRGKAFIHWGSFWQVDLSSYDIVTLYGISYIMGKFEEKLKRELKPGAKVASNIFKFPSWRHLKEKNGVYLYKQS
ncbi:MAG: hypothetical protein ACD_50C00204G0002 [uncultured bacterium]|nr:MAG: hypothetical protein ACD_50C00204G0002 [uncultured bacterium]